LPGDAVSLRCCHVRLFEELLCCRVQQKLPRGGVVVSYPLAVGELERVAGASIHASSNACYRFQDKDFLPRRTEATWATAVGRRHNARLAFGVVAHVSRACSTGSGRAWTVGTYGQGVPALVTCFQRCALGFSAGEVLGHGTTSPRSVCRAQTRGRASDVGYVAPSCISLRGGVSGAHTRGSKALEVAAVHRPAWP
jgi:hypothetical protein